MTFCWQQRSQGSPCHTTSVSSFMLPKGTILWVLERRTSTSWLLPSEMLPEPDDSPAN